MRSQRRFKVEVSPETDGRWIAEVTEYPGVLAYGATPDEAAKRVALLCLNVFIEKLQNGEEETSKRLMEELFESVVRN